MARSQLPKAPKVLPKIRKLYCYNPECPYVKRKGWVFGTIRLASEKGPFACKHCGEKLDQRCSIYDNDD